MDRRHRHRRLLATALAGGALVAVAVPRLVAADPAPPVWPVDLHPTVVDVAASSPIEAPAPAPTADPAPSPMEEPAVVPAPEVQEVADVPDVPEVPGVDEADVEVAAAPVIPVDVAEHAIAVATTIETPVEVAPSGGTLTVDVAPVDGADRFVSVRSATGAAGVGPLAVGSDTIVVELATGTYDLLVEQIAHGGGAFVTRTRFTMEPGGQVGATCDPETLDCAVVA